MALVTEAMWAQWDQENFRRHSVHETGHAVVGWLMGHEIEFIRMIGSGTFSAFVRFDFQPSTLLRHRLQNIAIDLAGPAAEARLSPPRAEGEMDWLQDLDESSLDQGDSDWKSLWELANMGGVSNRKAFGTVRRVAKWVDELLDIPRVWNLVEKLAGALKYGETMDGSDVAKLLEKEWGEGGSSSMPVLDLGRKWRRRFEVTREMMMKQMPQGYMPSIAERDQ